MKNDYLKEKSYPIYRYAFLYVFLNLFFVCSVFAQNADVRGRVFDKITGEPLVGVTILQKGTSNGVVTDLDGNYALKAPIGTMLEFKYIGYLTTTLKVKEKGVFNVGLVLDNNVLDEVVVVGYGSQKKVNLTGSVAAMKVDETIASRTVTNVSSALSGMIPGLAVQQSTGMAGASNSKLLVRGLGTVNDADPLIVVDGMPDVDINRIDMNDIESISVLKDASSSAIYGSRAANGVILVTTKTGKGAEKVQINYTGNFAVADPTKFYDILESYPKSLTLHQRASRAGRSIPKFNDGTIEQWLSMGMIDPIRFPNENQLDWVTRTGLVQSHNISAQGAGEKHNFYLSIGYLDEEGFMIKNDNNRYNFRFNMDYNIRKNIKVGARMDGQWTKMTYAYNNGFVDYNVDNLPTSVAITGIYPYNPETRQYGGHMAYGESAMAVNLYADINTRNNIEERQEYNGNIYGEWNVFDGFTARVDFGLNYYNQFVKSYQSDPGLQLWDFQTGKPTKVFIENSAGISNSTNQGYKTLLQFQLRYEKEIIKGHHLSAMVAMNEEYWYNRWFSAGRNDRLHGSLNEIDAALNTTQRTGGASDEEGLRSFLGRLNYSILDRYLFEFTFRADGSSKFLPGHQYGYFPSGSFGWRFSEEEFFEPLKKVLSSGKLRVSYGSLGNNSGVKKYEQKETFSSTPYALNGNTLVKGFSANKMINRDFTWEKTTVANIGLDLGFFNNQLTAEIDVYDRLTTGMIRPSQLSTLLSGYSAPRVNIGDLRNRGVELNLRWQSNIQKFNYGAAFNFSYNRDKLEKWNEYRNPSKIFIDMPYYFNYYTVSSGIAQTWEDIYNAPYQGTTTIAPGDLLYEDLNGDGQITGADKKANPKINEQRPTANYGLNLFAEWNGIDISMLFQGSTGRKDYWYGHMNAVNVGEDRHVFQEYHWDDTWSIDNRGAELPRLASVNTAPNGTESSFWLQDLSYLRMKNLQIGYNFPKKWLDKLTLNKVRCYMSAENLFTLTAWKGVDPEKARVGNNINEDPFPIMKTISFGINVGF